MSPAVDVLQPQSPALAVVAHGAHDLRQKRAAHGRRSPWWPKEHGVYGQLGLPLVTALAIGKPSLSGALLAAATIAAFAAHEPFLIMLGRRGARSKREHGRRAILIALVWAALAIVTGKAGMWIADADVWIASVLPLVLMAMWLPVVLRGAEKTPAGEIVAAATLGAVGIPVAVAGGVSLITAHGLWAAWCIAFVTAIAAVRWVISRHRRGRGSRESLAIAVASSAALAMLAPHSSVVWASLPPVIVGWLIMLWPPHPRRLKGIGWTLMGASALTCALAVTIVRLGG
jgi:hypothetical protein